MNQGMTLGFGQTAVRGTSKSGKVVSRKSGKEKSVLPIMPTYTTKSRLLNPAQTRKYLSVVQQYVQVKHKAIDFFYSHYVGLQMTFPLFKMSLSAAHTTAHQTAILGGRSSMESATSGARRSCSGRRQS